MPNNWTAIAAHPQARADQTIRDRLHHIHQVQRVFMWAIGDRATAPGITQAEDYLTFEAVRSYASLSHADIRRCAANLAEVDLERSVTIPWFSDPPLAITVAEALAQMTMHSQWHRGQNATRLRELGGQPPTIDLIVWYWKGRPSATL